MVRMTFSRSSISNSTFSLEKWIDNFANGFILRLEGREREGHPASRFRGSPAATTTEHAQSTAVFTFSHEAWSRNWTSSFGSHQHCVPFSPGPQPDSLSLSLTAFPLSRSVTVVRREIKEICDTSTTTDTTLYNTLGYFRNLPPPLAIPGPLWDALQNPLLCAQRERERQTEEILERC